MTVNTLCTPLEFLRPAAISFGSGTVQSVGAWAEERGLRRILVVADAFNANRVDLLRLKGEVTVFADVVAEPDVGNLDALLKVAATAKPDVVIGFGGGSVMDLAKLVTVLGGGRQSLTDIVGAERAKYRACLVIQIPTTAGTGSEAGTRALITDPATSAKLAVQSRLMLADLVVVDPDLTTTVPPRVTAETGVDALAHCVESFTSRKAHPLVDLYAIEGVRLIGRFLARAVADGGDKEARAGLALAALYGGFCLGPVNTAAGHAVAYPLGTRHHIPHGAANAVIFPHVLAFNLPAVPERTALVLDGLGLPRSAGKELALAYGYCESLGIEMHMSKRGVPEADLPVMAVDAFAIKRLLDNNPRAISQEQILEIYRAAY
ncbi:iron-containing alcohol dehydrogenase [Telmatospirillum sp.]|uniref:iron-containing alcohol dehydrogenase n=1 Tax=Telmatospirillum sp. TaxID=2079197 RepID=UPI0028519B34|nr:iron-containing alcohol dehydrogenase [Telmatospirillum sp.]MDR3440996.1 iron-containing alcohol dehydrogenase [Telmatospirillum sp.]